MRMLLAVIVRAAHVIVLTSKSCHNLQLVKTIQSQVACESGNKTVSDRILAAIMFPKKKLYMLSDKIYSKPFETAARGTVILYG